MKNAEGNSLVFVNRVQGACFNKLINEGVPDHTLNRLHIVPSVYSPIYIVVTMDGADDWIWQEPFHVFPSRELVNQILMLA